MDLRENDDFIHNPDPRRDHKNDQGGNIFTARGVANLGCISLLIIGILALLYVDATSPLPFLADMLGQCRLPDYQPLHQA